MQDPWERKPATEMAHGGLRKRNRRQTSQGRALVLLQDCRIRTCSSAARLCLNSVLKKVNLGTDFRRRRRTFLRLVESLLSRKNRAFHANASSGTSAAAEVTGDQAHGSHSLGSARFSAVGSRSRRASTIRR